MAPCSSICVTTTAVKKLTATPIPSVSANPLTVPVPVPSRDALREHLVATRIAGDVATPRQSNVKHYRKMAAKYQFEMLGAIPIDDFKRAAEDPTQADEDRTRMGNFVNVRWPRLLESKG